MKTINYDSIIKSICFSVTKTLLTPKKIIRSGPATIVFWEDDTKTVVKLADGDKADDYAAFCSAFVKRVFGSNSALKKSMEKAEVINR